MKSRALFAVAACVLGLALVLSQSVVAQQPAGAQGGGGRGAGGQGGGGGAAPATDFQPSRERQNVTATAIPGVIAAGAKWTKAFAGMDNADGIVALPDGSILIAQEQTNTVRKLDARDYDSAYVKDSHGTGALAIDAQGRLIGAERTCTDPGLNLTPQNPC